jgi:hypothetical protein
MSALHSTLLIIFEYRASWQSENLLQRNMMLTAEYPVEADSDKIFALRSHLPAEVFHVDLPLMNSSDLLLRRILCRFNHLTEFRLLFFAIPVAAFSFWRLRPFLQQPLH